MTISSQTRKAGPYSGTGSTGPFTFSFKVFENTDLLVVKVNNSTNVETTLALTTDYTVSLNSDQNANPGGTVTLVAALAVGYNMVISSQVPYLQEIDLTNQGGFYPEVVTDALDRLTIEAQQLKLDVDRSAKLPITSEADADSLVADIVRLADSADNIDTVAGSISNVNTAAGAVSNINTVAGSIANVNAVGGSVSNVNIVAPSIGGVNTVAGISGAVGVVSSINAAVSTVAGISSNVTTVAGISSAVTTVATNVVDVTNFSDVYYGPSASDPSTRRDGSALQTGDLYFNTSSGKMRAYTSTGWIDVGTPLPVTIAPQTFSGNGSTTAFTLTTEPAFPAALEVYISGVAQRLTTDFTVSGTTLTFTSAPPSGTNNIYVRNLSAYAGGVPNDGSVSTAKIADGAVTTVKIADANVTTAKIADSNVTAGKIADGAIGTAKIADANVTTAKIADANVTTAKIADSNVTTAKIADGAVTTVKITNANVTTAKIADAAITAAKLASGAARANFGSGTVLQVVYASDGTDYTTSSTSYQGGISASITPSSLSSKVLVMFSCRAASDSQEPDFHDFAIYRNGSLVKDYTYGKKVYSLYGNYLRQNFMYLDSPASASSVTYQLKHKANAGSSTKSMGANEVVLMEIAG